MPDKPRTTKTIRIPGDTYQYLKNEAHANKIPIGEYVNRLVEDDKRTDLTMPKENTNA
tara:strand:+ start:47 stop:220 length:174 start_codon:yes stop_codon:yes gene_type:complete